jgi:RNA polymerase sigma-70 factor (family 1)
MDHSTIIPAEDYLSLFQCGREKGFDHYFRQLYAPACYFAQRFIPAKEPGRDIVEECFIRLWQHHAKIQTEQGLRSYLYTSIYHACLRWKEHEQRRQKHEAASGYLDDTHTPAYLESYIATETVRQLYQAVDQLPAECRKVFTRIYIEGKSTKEVARELQLAESTVKSQKSRGISILRAKLRFILCMQF